MKTKKADAPPPAKEGERDWRNNSGKWRGLADDVEALWPLLDEAFRALYKQATANDDIEKWYKARAAGAKLYLRAAGLKDTDAGPGMAVLRQLDELKAAGFNATAKVQTPGPNCMRRENGEPACASHCHSLRCGRAP